MENPTAEITWKDEQETRNSVELEVYSPAGVLQETMHIYAPRLEDLRGKTICELSNGLWEAHRTFPLIRRALKLRIPDVRIVTYDELPFGARNIDVEDIGEILKERGCQAAIVGNSG